MKRSLLVAVFSVWVVCGAQTNFRFADSTAQWNVLRTEWCMSAPCVYFNTEPYEVNGDTTIGALEYQKLKHGNTINDFIRMDSSLKVFHLDNSGEYMIYNFGAVAGDTFRIRINQWAHDGFIEVLAVDTIILDKPRKRMQLCINYWAPDCTFQVITAIEGIGAINSHFLFPGLDYSYTDGPNYKLLCYYQNQNLVYHDSTEQSCSIDSAWNSLKETESLNFSIAPNPVTTYLNIQLQQTPTATTVFKLFDITGRIVLQQPLTATTNRMELNGVSKGMYLYSVVSEKEKAGTGKLIIE